MNGDEKIGETFLITNSAVFDTSETKYLERETRSQMNGKQLKDFLFI